MKRILALVLCTVMLLALCACGETNNSVDTAADTKAPAADTQANEPEVKKGTLKIGMECNYAPFNWSQTDDSNGAVPIANVDDMFANGYDVQIAKIIAETLGYDLEIYAYEWDALIPAVQSGTLDLIIAGMSPTEERKEKADFSDFYYVSNLVIVTKLGLLDDVDTIADLEGKKIAAQSGTSHLDALNDQTKAEVSELADFSTMYMALDAGTIDGYVSEEPTAMAIAVEGSEFAYIPFVNNDTGFEIPDEDSAVAVGAKLGSELIPQINEVLAAVTAENRTALMQAMVDIAPAD